MTEYYLKTIGKLFVELEQYRDLLTRHKTMLEDRDRQIMDLKNELQGKTKDNT